MLDDSERMAVSRGRSFGRCDAGLCVHSLWEAFSGKAWINSDGPWNSVRTNKSSALVYIDVANATMLSSLDVQWNDPIDDMISMIQELSLRTAIVTTSSAPQILGTYDPEFTTPKAEQER